MYDIHINVAISLARDWENNRSPNIIKSANPKWNGKTVAEALMDVDVLRLIRARAAGEFRNCQGLKPDHIRVFERGDLTGTEWEVVTKIRGYVYFATEATE